MHCISLSKKMDGVKLLILNYNDGELGNVVSQLLMAVYYAFLNQHA